MAGSSAPLDGYLPAASGASPFGKEIVYDDENAVSFLLNILWIIFGGIEMAIGNALIGIILCITVIGIPWGKQYFKIAKLSLMPFGARVEREHIL